jgi:hypothetical protein
MVNKGRAKRDGLGPFEGLLGRMIGGTEVKHEVMQLIQAASGPTFLKWPSQIHRAASSCLTAKFGWRLAARLWR